MGKITVSGNTCILKIKSAADDCRKLRKTDLFFIKKIYDLFTIS